MSTILDGRAVADSLLIKVKEDVAELKAQGVAVKLVVVLVGDNPASEIYVRHKEKACERTGIISEKISYPDDVSQEELIAKIEELNADESVHGMIVQLPLPKHISEPLVIRAVNPYKDVDGFHAYNVGKMF